MPSGIIEMSYLRGLVAAEISRFTRYYDRVVQWQVLDHDSGALLEQIESPRKESLGGGSPLPDMSGEEDERTAVLLNGNLNHNLDVEAVLAEAAGKMGRGTRLVVVAYNPYLKGALQVAHALDLRGGVMPSTFVTETSLRHMCKLAGLEIVRHRPVGYAPAALLGLGAGLNRAASCLPLVARLGLISVILLRSTRVKSEPRSLSVVIPARNERGNIEDALVRLRPFNERVDLEVIFVEGHSSDGTWEKILQVKAAYAEEFRIQAFQQPGKGKNDAVRVGFARAHNDLLTILDADLTMPPELLPRFYDAYHAGLGDFINGDRLVYPMEGEAMRSLNLLGNLFFAKTLSQLLDAPLGDSLCGTKLLSRLDYQRVLHWREDFGDFDPFGDFELLFPAAVLGLGIVDIPIRYRARRYGATQISRFSHGTELLKMTLVGLGKIKPGPG